jgi:hypothetical protein
MGRKLQYSFKIIDKKKLLSTERIVSFSSRDQESTTVNICKAISIAKIVAIQTA